ncbi:SAM-dependent methyltransferase [Anaerotignum sp.]|uniref:SAM-dependent methyltransferase n=1 Tax=Anaerotignum sp. TaxID=2039241 RepID=UPI003A94930A
MDFPYENYEFFRSLGIEEQIFPIYADANALPFAEGFFDAVISVDAYHYFGAEAGFFSEKILPLLKPDGFAALIFPGWKAPLPTPVPQELLLSWTEEDLTTFQPIQWWKKLFEQEEHTRLLPSQNSPALMKPGLTGWQQTIHMPSVTDLLWNTVQESI